MITHVAILADTIRASASDNLLREPLISDLLHQVGHR